MPLVRTPTIVLVGNPNTGKTTLFNALAGMRQRVGNYPGVTVETKKGQFRCGEQSFAILDLPGTYSFAARSPDEMVAVDVVLGRQSGEPRPDLIVTIVDAANLERNLYLTSQALELGVPVVVALNMMDVAEAQGISIDVERLAQGLGVPIVPLQAHKGKGIPELKQAISKSLFGPAPANAPVFPDAFEAEVTALREIVGDSAEPFLVRRLLIDIDGHAEEQWSDEHGNGLGDRLTAARQRLAAAGCPIAALEARTRYGWIRETTAGCIRRPDERTITWTDRLDQILTHRLWGSGIFLVLMFLVFQSIFVVAQYPTAWIESGQAWLEGLIDHDGFLAVGPLRSLLVKGIIGGVGGILVFLPQILILFAVIAFLEDCGYMARAAFLMDKIMSRCGLSGKSFIPMLSSVACAIPGIMAARVIENKRDRFATILVAPLMSCSARLPVYMLLIAAFLSTDQGYPIWVPGLTLFSMYMIGLIVAPLVAWALKGTVLRGPKPAFVMEMPSYKTPSLRTVGQRMFEAGWLFVRRAGTIILATMIVVWSLLYFTIGERTGQSYEKEISDTQTALEEKQEKLDDLTGKPAPINLIEINKLKAEISRSEKKVKLLHKNWSSDSVLGWAGKSIEPLVRPLGWDWRIGMAALASFPAREVFVGAMGIIYSQGEGEADDEDYQQGINEELRRQTWDDDPQGAKVFTVPVALSVMVFFALCCQCASTLAVIKRETNSWKWPIFTFVYMTLLAYLAALVVYQIGSLFL